MAAPEGRFVIATRRGLVVLLVLAVLLAAWLVHALTRGRPGPVERALAPGLDVDRVSELVWERSPRPAVVVSRTGGGWRWRSGDDAAAADGDVVRDALVALRGARWHRRADRSRAGSVGTLLTVKGDAATRTIGIGQPLEGTEQQWLVVGDEALLVDRWVARALAPDPFTLRVRRVVDDVRALDRIGIVVGGVELGLRGRPWRLEAPSSLLPKQELVTAFVVAVDALELVRASRPPPSGATRFAIDVGGRARFAATCPDDPSLAWMSSPAGNGCIARSQFDALERAVTALAGGVTSYATAPAALVESRPVPFDIDAVVLVDGATLDLAKRPEIAGRPADGAAVAELLAALGAPAQVIAAGEEAARATVRVNVRGGGVISLALLGGGKVRRDDERVALRLTPAAYAALNRGAADLGDRAVWHEEPTTISEVTIDGITYQRGAVLGEWKRTPPGLVDGAQLEALVAVLADLQRSQDVSFPAKQHEVTLLISPPAGAPVRHTLAIGAPRQGGCPARADQASVLLPTTVCATIAALGR